ncbi:MAG: long-chain-fatty-acid--CoA ligase [Alphaproteobacteria bacterium]|nr:long-chain-fatty-acid--CoA ligase [Alphaproteobacteria bacterium]
MLGLMQDHSLAVGSVLPFAERQFGHVEVVSGATRLTYGSLAGRVRRLAAGLVALGVRPGDMVTTLAWNTHRQLELFHATAALGAVLHTANPRLGPDQLAYTIGHAGSGLLFADLDGLALCEPIADRLTRIKGTVLLCDPAAMPAACRLPDPISYDALLEAADAPLPPPPDERAAAYLCYTSGTTGLPKGALYSHRACMLSSLSLMQPNGWNLGADDVVLAVPPLFHCVGWGVPFMAPMVGAKLVLPGRDLDPARLLDLIEGEGVTMSLGVPTIWQGLLDHLSARNHRLTGLKCLGMGGSAPPPALVDAYQKQHGVRVIPAWGMTETTIGCSLAVPLASDLPARARALMAGQGRPVFGAEFRSVDEAGRPVPPDGTSIGHIQVRGHWVAARYFRAGEPATDADGWLPTGDIGTLDGQGFMRITDRAKDAIKSGGEWISSIELENLAIAHPDVAEAGAVGMPHAKWGERPVMALVRCPGATLDGPAFLAWLAPQIPKWWLPESVLFVDSLPRTPTAKIRKAELRDRVRQLLKDAAPREPR